MENYNLMVAMAEECKRIIRKSDAAESRLPKPLHPKHLLWMCTQIEAHAANAPAVKLHRWIGFVQAAMLANRMIDLDGAKEMFEKAKAVYGDRDDDLLDHLDTQSSFQLEIGGQG